MKMKKEYIKPEAEMLKFVETEEIMTQNDLFTFEGANPTSMDPKWVL